MKNPKLVALAQKEAQRVIEEDPTLRTYPTLRKRLDQSAPGRA